jgi:hypothetical protein
MGGGSVEFAGAAGLPALGTAVIGVFAACLLAGAARRQWRRGRNKASTQWEPT